MSRGVELAAGLFARLLAALTLNGRYEDGVLDRGLALAFGDFAMFDPHKSDRFALAIERWRRVAEAVPDSPLCRYCLSASLRKAGIFHLAGEVMDEAVAAFPRDLGTTLEMARVAESLGDFAKARDYWHRATQFSRPRPLWLTGEAHALVVLGCFDEAKAVLDKARARYPSNQGLMAVECMLASSREDWSQAIPLWTAYRRRFPDDQTGWEQLGRAVQAKMLGEVTQRANPTAGHAAPPNVGRVEDEAARQLLLRFESIGDNCEFGSVQRRFGAEPLGLLRWNQVSVEGLISALEHRLDGMGEPANTEMFVLGNGEFFVRDLRWDLGMHTFLFEGQTDRDALFAKMCQRIVYLKDKFLADLAAAEKTFVYRSPGLDGHRLAALHHTLRRFGPNRLLAVQPAGSTSSTDFCGRAGEVKTVEPGCFVGFIGRLGVAADWRWDIAFDDWLAVCRHTAAA